MFDWVKLIVLVLQVVEKLVSWRMEKGLLDEGARREIAKQNVELLRQLDVVGKIKEDVSSMSDGELDEFLLKLGGDEGERPPVVLSNIQSSDNK